MIVVDNCMKESEKIMDQARIEEMVRSVLAEETNNKVDKNNDNISPLLKDLRDSVQEKIKDHSSDDNVSSLLESVKKDVENRIV
ncbi:MAG: hypothetical protein LKF37_11015 [Lentilactobacillus diolivorans]|jgi:gas vesicle protein|uniref:hypothetical protein n=1 Tax=Lentilactobacillus diolivorans TaxID=179838 RepID=UPI000FF0CF84|nr:hypothetical protein [Lentilactobacillus diolivorans]MCH4165292.1 hypothetical protein [Lentilactobacillus diolivorans]MDH5106523.1 hypothetical protein [Lentilactobacillus diolivorans]RRG03128.1 MAG: hypothetical protein DUD34_06030 [Lactobacillus sp.]